MVLLWGTDVMTSFRYHWIYYMLILYYLFLRTSICTCVMVLRLLLVTLLFYFLEPLYAQVLQCWVYYLFIFNSGMECSILSYRCGRLYFPMFLYRVGLFTLMYMVSLIALAINGTIFCYLEMIEMTPNMTFLAYVMPVCWQHITLMASSIAPLHLLGQ